MFSYFKDVDGRYYIIGGDGLIYGDFETDAEARENCREMNSARRRADEILSEEAVNVASN